MNYICLLVYVDDTLISSPNESLIVEIKEVLHKAFTIKDIVPAHYFLGMEVARSDSGIIINQRKYVLDQILSIGLQNCHSASTPFPLGIKLSKTKETSLDNPDVYRRLVGRPDITYAVQ